MMLKGKDFCSNKNPSILLQGLRTFDGAGGGEKERKKERKKKKEKKKDLKKKKKNLLPSPQRDPETKTRASTADAESKTGLGENLKWNGPGKAEGVVAEQERASKVVWRVR